MTALATHGFHPASLLFPLLDGNDLARLAADIREHGLLEPIVLLDGQVLDGRNRLRACEAAGVEPRFVEWESSGGLSPAEWVVSANLHRRHLTVGQRAALALDLLPHLEEEARERQATSGPGVYGGQPLTPQTEEAVGEATEKAAARVGVGRTTVATVKAIQGRNPDVVMALRTGEITVAKACREVGFTRGTNDPPVADDLPSIYYGKGDKWREANEPLRRYLASWKKRGYVFGHVKPRDARKRVAAIDALIAELQSARSDLESRSHTYRLSA